MKKIVSLTALVILSLSGAASANSHQSGSMYQSGFTGTISAISVQQAKQLPDDAWVILRGNIVQRLTEDNYLFKDGTGEIQVEIDHDKWRGISISPADLVEITGEIDKDWISVEIDVKNVTKITQ